MIRNPWTVKIQGKRRQQVEQLLSFNKANSLVKKSDKLD
ncbi:hypothetical protein SS05631_a47410 (plasmid) [Sinorhizobium sp. CCBAU 05631]|nr:hypothetical protein SS05631_a47410 [Sinorhizobium sp. CCBAU 05631]